MNKDKLRQHFHKQQKHFSPFMLSVYKMLGKEAQVVLATLSQLMAKKMEEPISHIQGWFNGRIEIVVARLYSQMLCRAQVSSPLRTQEPYWGSGLGLNLAQ